MMERRHETIENIGWWNIAATTGEATTPRYLLKYARSPNQIVEQPRLLDLVARST